MTEIYNVGRQCRDKKRYYDEKTANKQVSTMNGAYPRYIFNSYFCPHCHYWHVGRRRKPVEIKKPEEKKPEEVKKT